MLSKQPLVAQIFMQPKLLIILILGMVSGMPMGFFLGMLSAWLYDVKLGLATISLFAIARTPYSFKYIWAPIVDHFNLPILYKLFGRRRSWMLLANIGTILALIAVSLTDPTINITLTIFFACLFGLCASTYDIAFDAFRIEALNEEQQALGVATTTLGYRLGMIAVSFGSLTIADIFSWQIAFYYVISLFATGMFVVILANDPAAKNSDFKFAGLNLATFDKAVIQPFTQFFKRDSAIIILLTVILYKLGEAMLGSMTTPFYRQIGFTNTEIAYVSKIFGVMATLVGVFIGAYISAKLGNLRSLMLCGTGQMLSNLMFVWQNYMGHDVNALMVTLAIENVTGGMGSAALMGYMSALCNKNYTATHYALLSSFASFANNVLTVKAGALAKALGWDMFFIFTSIISLPALILIGFLDKKLKYQHN